MRMRAGPSLHMCIRVGAASHQRIHDPLCPSRRSLRCIRANILDTPDKSNSDAPHRPPIRPNPAARSKFDLEPNPFEQSFSARSHRSQSDAGPDDSAPVGVTGESAAESGRERGKTPPRGGDATATKPNALPPLSSLTSPAAADPTQFPWLANQSLRAGPLSPAMLAGPQGKSGAGAAGEGEGGFDVSTFRTGFTPGTGTGFTPSYSSLMGGSSFNNLPLPSPNTAAFLNMVTNATPIEADTSGQTQAQGGNKDGAATNGNGSGNGAQGPGQGSALPPHMQGQHGLSHLGAQGDGGDTITPNTLNALTGVFNDMNRQTSQQGQNGAGQQGNAQGQGQGRPGSGNNSATNSASQVPTQGQGQAAGHPPMHHQHSGAPGMHGAPGHPHMPHHPSYYPGPGGPAGPPGQPVDYAQQSANAASQAANGLFLLSQAHQELSKREEDSRGPMQGHPHGPPAHGQHPHAHLMHQHSSQASLPGHGHMAPHLPHAHQNHQGMYYPQGPMGAQGPGQGHPGMDKRSSGSVPPTGAGAGAGGKANGGGTKRKSDASAAGGPGGGKAKKGKKAAERNGSVGATQIPGTGMSMGMGMGMGKGESTSPMGGDDSDVEEMGTDGGMDGEGGDRKPETEEEKRKNFLERNRQGKSTILRSLFLGFDCVPVR